MNNYALAVSFGGVNQRASSEFGLIQGSVAFEQNLIALPRDLGQSA